MKRREFIALVGGGAAASWPFAALAQQPEFTGVSVGIMGALSAIGAQWLWFICLFAMIGAVVFRFVLVRRANSSDGDAFTHIASINSATLGVAAGVGALLTTILLRNAASRTFSPGLQSTKRVTPSSKFSAIV